MNQRAPSSLASSSRPGAAVGWPMCNREVRSTPASAARALLTFGIELSALCFSYGPKGQDNLAQGLPWVIHRNVFSPEGPRG
jgi:hypothetical protein